MADFSDERVSLCSEVQMYTPTSHKRIVTLAAAVEYVGRRGIPGYFVECGVWLAGSAMVIAKALVRLGVVDRRIWLYDTFGAMPQPEQHERDVDRDFGGRLPQRLTSDVAHGEYLPAVRANVASTRYPQALVSYVCGLAEKTMAAAVPEQ